MHFRENWLIFLGIWGEAELFLRIWGAKANTFRETRKLFAGRWVDQCIIFRDQGSTDPPPLGGLTYELRTLLYTVLSATRIEFFSDYALLLDVTVLVCKLK